MTDVNGATRIDEPIAVVGIGCRLPGGVHGPESLWTLLEGGTDAIGPIPPERWDADRYYHPQAQRPGRMNAREGGFLERADAFDANFFGISGRIAEQMDPQQRLLLEVSWEAFEDAGIVPGLLAGERTGVFVGACSQDYGGLQSSFAEVDGLGAHSATGTFMSIVSNRLSYTYDLRGPSMTVDTACSSSLVAVHLACESIHRGESELAIAGGVSLMLTPQFAIALSQASMLSPDARSRAFSADANGYVRGEGAGLVVLKPLSRAQFDRDRIYAVIGGSAVNQDGRTQGITVPSGQSQETNFRASLSSARVAPKDVGYVEAHGTGTPVGDPIEANALGRVLAENRDHERVAYVGSVKTNIGHLEGAAGVAGLIKAALSVYHRRVPASLHHGEPNPEIDFERWRMAVPTGPRPWPAGYERAIASVNSFGFGGTNANVMLLEAPVTRDDAPAASEVGPAVLTFSARSTAALEQLAERHAEALAAGPVDLGDYARNLARRRGHHGHRLAVVAADPAQAAARLRQFRDNPSAPGVTTGRARKTAGRVAFLFNGQGPQWFAMGRALIEQSPVFRATVAECDRLARKYLSWSIMDALTASEEDSRVHETHCLQPTMFAVQVALAELWRSWGVEPDGVAGHSMGEIAAAHVSGALDLDSALKVICRRARIQEKADDTGAMMFIALGREEVLELCDGFPGQVWLSAENSGQASTVSGRRETLEKLAGQLAERGVFARILKVNCACHSQDMDPLRDELIAELAGVEGGQTSIPMYSTVTGTIIDGSTVDTSYWWRNFRDPVLFAPAVRAMLADGFDTFIELSPHPVLGNSLRELAAEHDGEVLVLSSLAREKDDWEQLLTSLATLYVSGGPIDWARRHPGAVRALSLPGNPWIRERFWNESAVTCRERTGRQGHPMLKRVDGPKPVWEIRWDDHRLAWVSEHDVLGSVIVPGAAYVEAALAAAREVTGVRCDLEFVEFERPCVLGTDEAQLSRIELDPAAGTFEVCQRPVSGDTWVRNAYGRFYRAADRTPDRSFDVDELRARCPEVHKPADIYALFTDRGYAYGPSFCGIDRLHVGDGEALARIRTPRVLKNKVAGYLFHPAVLDACFQSSILHPLPERPDALLPFTYLPTSIEHVRLYGDPAEARWCYTRLRKHDPTGLSVEIYVLGDDGTVVAEYAPLRGKVVRQSALDAAESVANHFYVPAWEPATTGNRTGAPRDSALTQSPSAIGRQLASLVPALAERMDRPTYETGYQDDLARLCAAYVVRCLRRFGRELTMGETFAVGDFCGLRPEYTQAFLGHLRFLVDDGFLREDGGVFTVVRSPNPDPTRMWRALLTQYPSCVWELLLVRRTGEHLHDVLTGATDPLGLLFPEGSKDEAESIYQSSPIARYYNVLARRAVELLSESADRGRTLRVLEVGGGTGGLTANVLPVLQADRCEYVFTDISPAFVQAATDRFARYEFLTGRTLDIEADLESQGIEPGSFDLVLASDVVHATADLKRTVLQLQEALAPGGVLAMIEASPGNRWLDLTFGLTEGWWRFRDLRLRPDGPLLCGPQWADLLASVGFDDVAALDGDGDPATTGRQTLLLACAPSAGEPEPVTAGRDRRSPESAGVWVVFADSGDMGMELAGRISAHGGRVITVRPGAVRTCGEIWTVRPGHAEDYDRLFAEIDPEHVVDLWQTGHGSVDGDVAGAAEDSCFGFVQVLRALDRKNPARWPAISVFTRGAQAHRNDDVRLAGAPVWGIGLVAGLEFPDVRCKLVDLDAVPAAGEVDEVWAELLRPDHEREVVLRSGERFVRRLTAVAPGDVRGPVDARELPHDTGFVLDLPVAGTFDELRYQAVRRAEPAAGQVEIEVAASGLNFLDAMTALGQVPTLESARGYRFGAECAGTVTRVGPGVRGLSVGDAVVAVASAQGTVASHVVVGADCVVHKPRSLSFEEAASIPIVFLTAWFALHKLARVQPGERVLIHSAAGGTGLAAVQLARLAGAEVFATAGTPEKRSLLRSLGVEHVMDSRSLTFADKIRAVTDGRGVDIVVSAATGDVVDRSLACLAAYGRYVDIGKRDLLGDRKLGMRPFLRNLAYFSFDLRQLMIDRPDQVRSEFATIMALFGDGPLRPLPFRVFHPAWTETAFRQLASAKHIGKVVLAMDEREVRVSPVPVPALSAQAAAGTWLITGGCGGVGLGMAGELARAGVRNLVLVGRSGAMAPEARARIDQLRATGVRVVVEAADISSRTALRGVLDRIRDEQPELKGVLHCAMVLDDALIPALDEETIARVTAPKIRGAWHLHELTADLPLEAFVLFSSASSMVGNVGQANYAAANAFLDQLAEARRATGACALTVNWGAISDTGYVARHDEVARLVAASGMRSFTVAEAYRTMTALWHGNHARVGVLPMDWPRFFAHHGLDSVRHPAYRRQFATHATSPHLGERGAAGSLGQQLRSQATEGRGELLKERLKERVATVLGIPLAELDEDMPLMDYLDSLLAVEISSWLERQLNAKVTIIELMKGPSVNELTTQLLAQVGAGQAPEPTAQAVSHG